MLPIVKKLIFAEVNGLFRCKNNKMAENIRYSSFYARSPVYQLFAALLFILVAGSLIFMAFLAGGIYIFKPDLEFLSDPSFSITKTDISFLRYLLISQHISLFIIPGIILIYKLKPDNGNLFGLKIPSMTEAAYVIILAICLLPLTGFTGELNSGMHLPEWLAGLEKWMREKEDMAERLIETVLNPDTTGSFAVNFIMIAVLPAIGEELIFRGVLQKILTRLFNSGHLAILITSILFSALHLQFYGFLPRFILGLVFGYLFFWSGTLWLPVIAHFANNAVSVILVYLQNSDIASVPDEISFWKQISALLLPLITGILIMIYIRRKYRKQSVYF